MRWVDLARCTSVTSPNHGQEPPLSRAQADNLLAILGAACGNGQMPLRKPDWDALARAANSQMLTALFYAGASQYADFVAWLPERRERLRRETVAQVGSQAMRTQRFLGLYQALLEAGLRPLVLKGIASTVGWQTGGPPATRISTCPRSRSSGAGRCWKQMGGACPLTPTAWPWRANCRRSASAIPADCCIWRSIPHFLVQILLTNCAKQGIL